MGILSRLCHQELDVRRLPRLDSWRRKIVSWNQQNYAVLLPPLHACLPLRFLRDETILDHCSNLEPPHSRLLPHRRRLQPGHVPRLDCVPPVELHNVYEYAGSVSFHGLAWWVEDGFGHHLVRHWSHPWMAVLRCPNCPLHRGRGHLGICHQVHD